ncbi:MAG: ATP-binding protein [Phycisphaerales bacterium]
MTRRLLILLAIAAALAGAGLFVWPRAAGAVLATCGVVAVLVMMYERSAGAAQVLGEEVSRLAEAAGVPPPGESPAALAATIRLAGDRLLGERSSLRDRASAATGALTAIPDPVVVVDRNGRAQLANAALGTLAGVHPMGRTLDELFPASDLPRLVAEALGVGAATDQVTFRRASGPRTWEVRGIPLRAEGAEPAMVLLAFRDVTEGARALQVRADFVANASHELRTPITAIRMALETLDMAGPDEATRARVMAMVGTQVARLEELVRDLLDLSRLESEAEVRHEPVALEEVAGALRARFARAIAERRLTLEFAIAPAAATVRSDRRLLELILGNLVENSAKFAFEGTAVRVTAGGAGAGALVLEVIDRGIGIPLDQQERVFERFYQVDTARSGARRGSGLGLAIAKHAARRLGGSIRVQSVWQQGTTMTVELPGAAPRG